MTSLRDVDAGGVILRRNARPMAWPTVNLEATRQVMRFIRGQRLAVRADVDAEPPPLDDED